MQLPAEIRLIILKTLLGTDSIILTFREARREKTTLLYREYWQTLQKTVQVLRVCQTLWSEGNGIFYGNTSLSMVVEQTHPPRLHISVLLWSVYLKYKVEDLDCYSDAYRQISGHAATFGDEVDKRRLSAMMNIQRYTVKVRLIKSGGEREALFGICRLLRRTLRGKDVTFDIQYKQTGGKDMSRPTDQTFFSGFKFLECRSLKFAGVEALGLSRDLADTTKPPVDTLKLWIDFDRKFVLNLPSLDDKTGQPRTFMKDHDDKFQKLLHHTLDYDHESFTKQQQELMSLAIKWNKQCVEWKAASLLAEIDRIARDTVTLNQRIQDQLEAEVPDLTIERVYEDSDYDYFLESGTDASDSNSSSEDSGE